MKFSERKKKQTFDIAANLMSLDITENTLRLSLFNPDGAVLKPTDVLDLLHLDHWIDGGATITRVSVRLKKESDDTTPGNFASSGNVPSANASTDPIFLIEQ